MSTKRLSFDNARTGTLAAAATFTAARTTLDGLGAAVASGVPRYDRHHLLADLVQPSKTLALATASVNVFCAGGWDSDYTTPLAVVSENSGRVRIFRNSLGSTPIYDATRITSGQVDLAGGTVSGKRYYPVAWMVAYGNVSAACVRYNTAAMTTEQGVSILQTTDYGVTWTVVHDMPDSDAGHARLAQFCWQNFTVYSEGGSPVAFVAAVTDYLNQPADRGQAAMLFARLVGGKWTWALGKQLPPGATLTGKHAHTANAGIIDKGDGTYRVYAIVSWGDAVARNRIALHWCDVADLNPATIQAATWNSNEAWHGIDAADVDYPTNARGLLGSQATSICACGDGNTFLLASDIGFNYVYRLTVPDLEDDWSTARASLTGVGPYIDPNRATTGGYAIEAFAVVCFDPINRVGFALCASHVFHTSGGPHVSVGCFSPDGNEWSTAFQPDNPDGAAYIYAFGDKIIQPKNAVGVYQWDKPTGYVRRRPMLLGPGIKNLTHKFSGWIASPAGVTITVLEPDGSGDYFYPVGTPRAGQAMPRVKGTGPVLYLTADGSADASYATGQRAGAPLTNAASANNRTDPATNLRGSLTWGVLAVEGGGGQATGYADFGTETVSLDTLSNGDWQVVHQVNTALSDAPDPHIIIGLFNGAVLYNRGLFVQLISYHDGDETVGIGYPPAVYPGSSASVHELASVEAVTLPALWSVRAALCAPTLGRRAGDRYLVVLKVQGEETYAGLRFTDDFTIEGFYVDNGGTPVTDTAAVFAPNTVSGMQHRVAFSQTAADSIEFLVSCAGGPVQTITLETTTPITGACDLYLCADQAQGTVTPFAVYDVSVTDTGLTEPQRGSLLRLATAPEFDYPRRVTAMRHILRSRLSRRRR